MYNSYLSRFPTDLTDNESLPLTQDPPPAPQKESAEQKNSLSDLLSSESILVPAVLFFLAYQSDELDTDLLILAAVLLLLGF